MKRQFGKLGKKFLAAILTMALIASMAAMMITPALAAEPEEEFWDYIGRMEAAILDIEAVVGSMGASSTIDLYYGYSLDIDKAGLQAHASNIRIDIDVAKALAGIDNDGFEMENGPEFDDPRFGPVQNSNLTVGYEQSNFNTLISRSGGNYGAAVRYINQGGIREGQRTSGLNPQVQWFFSFKSMLNPAYTASASSGLMGSISESGTLPNNTTLADLAENHDAKLVGDLKAKIDELDGYAAEAQALANDLLSHDPDCDGEDCYSIAHLISGTEEDFIQAVETFISLIETDISVICDLATGDLKSGEWLGYVDGLNAYNNIYAISTKDKLNAAFSFLDNGGYHDGEIAFGLPYSINHQLSYSSCFTDYDVDIQSYALYASFRIINSGTNVLPVVSGMLELLKVGATPQFPVMTPLQQARYNYNQSLKRLNQIKNDPSGVVSAVLSSDENIAQLVADLNTLIGSLDDIVAILDLIAGLDIGTDILDSILGVVGLNSEVLSSLAGLRDILNNLGIDTSGELSVEESLEPIVGGIISFGIDAAIALAEGDLVLYGLFNKLGAYNSAAAILDGAYDLLTQDAIDGLMDLLKPVLDPLNAVRPYLTMLSSGISLVKDAISLYEQVTGLFEDFSAGNIAGSTYSLADVCEDLANLLDALEESNLSDLLSGLFGDGGVGGGLTGMITGGLAGLLGGWMNDTIGTDLGLGDADLGVVNDLIGGLADGLLGNLSGLSDLLRATSAILRNIAGLEQGVQDLFNGDYMDALNALITEFTTGKEFNGRANGSIITNTINIFGSVIGMFTGASTQGLAAPVAPLDIATLTAFANSDLAPIAAVAPFAPVHTRNFCPPDLRDFLDCGLLDHLGDFMGCLEEFRDTLLCIKDLIDCAESFFCDPAELCEFASRISCYFLGSIMKCIPDFNLCDDIQSMIDCFKAKCLETRRELCDMITCFRASELWIEDTKLCEFAEGFYQFELKGSGYYEQFLRLLCILEQFGIKGRYVVTCPDDLFGIAGEYDDILVAIGTLVEADMPYTVYVRYELYFDACEFEFSCFNHCSRFSFCGFTIPIACTSVIVSEDCGGEDPPGEITVTFNANGGSVDPGSLKTDESGRLTSLPTPTRSGDYTFLGWFTAATGGTQIFAGSEGTVFTANTTIYAHWQAPSGPGGPGGPGPGGYGPGGAETNLEDEEVPLAELDMDNHFAYMIGYEDGTIRPQREVTRAEVATIFFRLLTQASREEIWSQTNDFSDVPAAAWYNNAISTLVNGGILTGYADGTFKPNATITRAEFAVMAVRFQFDGDLDTLPDSSPFADVNGHWAEGYIALAVGLGYVQGYDDGTFRPNAPVTRAEVATMINNALNRHVDDEEDLLDDMNVWADNQPGAWYYFALQEATNSHLFDRKDDRVNETWTSMRADPDWSILEQPDSKPGDLVYDTPAIEAPPEDGGLDDSAEDGAA